MAYVLTIYYIGFGNRYDGSGNTDTATIRLFHSKKKAIQAATEYIQEIIDEQIGDGCMRNDTVFNDEENMKRRLKDGDVYNFEDTYMFDLEHCNIE